MAEPKVAIVLPAYYAAQTLSGVFEQIPMQYRDLVFLVDDASQDGTFELAQNLGIRSVQHEVNRGYGANQKSCYDLALNEPAEIIIMIHPDGQHDPAVIPKMVELISSNKADAVFGSRMMKKTDALKGRMPWWKFGFNIILTKLANWLTGSKISDWHTGYRAYRREVFQIPYRSFDDHFNFDVDMTMALIKRGCRIAEIPVDTRYFKEASQIKFLPSVRYGLKFLSQIMQ